VAKRTILIVDDEHIVAEQLAQRLTGLGYAVTAVASSGEAAAALAARPAPDVLLIEEASRGDGTDTGEAGLARAEDRFFAVSIDMICCLDFSGHFKRLNPAWERALGFTREELMSKPFIEFVHPDDRERTLQQNRDVRGGGQALSFENRYLCKDGSYRWLRWNAAPDAAERVIYSVARDVTAAKQAEEERERLVRELQSALAEVKILREILPLCSYCRKIRDDENAWHTVEHYIAQHTTTRFSHGICPSCMATEVEPQFRVLERG